MARTPDVRGVDERPYPVDAPRRRGRPKKESAESKIERDAMIGILSTAISAVFIPLSIPLGPHWLLSDEEATTLADSLQKALSTLPNNTYGDLQKYLNRFVPWVALILTAGQIVAPKIEETQRRRANRGAEDFPSTLDSPTTGNADPAMWGRSNVDGHGSQTGYSDTFGAFPGAD